MYELKNLTQLFLKICKSKTWCRNLGVSTTKKYRILFYSRR